MGTAGAAARWGRRERQRRWKGRRAARRARKSRHRGRQMAPGRGRRNVVEASRGGFLVDPFFIPVVDRMQEMYRYEPTVDEKSNGQGKGATWLSVRSDRVV